MNSPKNIKIALVGGGTGGPITPLLGIVDELKKRLNQQVDADNFDNGEFKGPTILKSKKEHELHILWLGTGVGPEKWFIDEPNITFKKIICGKWRRYFDIRNITDIFKVIIGFFQSIIILCQEKPKVIISVGSFVSVPVAWAAKLCKIPVLIHQQDARVGLANRLVAPVAKVVTVTFDQSLKNYGAKAIVVGNTVRPEFRDNKITSREAKQKLGFSSKKPLVLVMGGGTGAQFINDILEYNLDKLTSFCQVLHLTGEGKYSDKAIAQMEANPNYKFFEFLDTFGMIKALSAAIAVVSRAGMATLTELSYLAKPTILIPIANTHQEDNARVFADKMAAIILEQKKLTRDEFIANVRELVYNEMLRRKLSENIKEIIKPDASREIADILVKFL